MTDLAQWYTLVHVERLNKGGKEMKEEEYKIMRYKQNGKSKVIKIGLTLQEAREHCNDPLTSGEGWFDGYTKEVKT